MFDFKSSPLFVQAKKAKFSPSMPILIIIVFVIFYISQFVSAVPLGVLSGIFSAFEFEKMGAIGENGELLISSEEMLEIMTRILSTDIMRLAALFLTVTTIVITVLWCRFIEKRSLSSMGFVKKNFLLQYIFGMLVGLVMFAVVFLICVATKAIDFNGFNASANFTMIALFFLAFIIQGASEEILMRGFFMISATRTSSVFTAILVSSVAFSLLHSGNSGVSVLAFINILLFGVFCSLYMIRTSNIWGVCAIHSVWNFAQGNIFGCLVSGMNLSNSLFLSEIDANRVTTNGGEFGPEGGVAVTLVLVIAIMLVVFIPTKNKSMSQVGQKEDSDNCEG